MRRNEEEIIKGERAIKKEENNQERKGQPRKR